MRLLCIIDANMTETIAWISYSEHQEYIFNNNSTLADLPQATAFAILPVTSDLSDAVNELERTRV